MYHRRKSLQLTVVRTEEALQALPISSNGLKLNIHTAAVHSISTWRKHDRELLPFCIPRSVSVTSLTRPPWATNLSSTYRHELVFFCSALTTGVTLWCILNSSNSKQNKSTSLGLILLEQPNEECRRKYVHISLCFFFFFFF